MKTETIAMFIMAGMTQNQDTYNEALAAYGQGELELVMAIVDEVVPDVNLICQQSPLTPAMFCYDVAEKLGVYLVQTVAEGGEVPPLEEWRMVVWVIHYEACVDHGFRRPDPLKWIRNVQPASVAPNPLDLVGKEVDIAGRVFDGVSRTGVVTEVSLRLGHDVRYTVKVDPIKGLDTPTPILSRGDFTLKEEVEEEDNVDRAEDGAEDGVKVTLLVLVKADNSSSDPETTRLQVGNTVRLSEEGKKEYINTSGNPHNMTGAITEVNPYTHPYRVNWDNGETNVYKEGELELADL